MLKRCFMLILIFVAGCTEKMSIAPAFSDNAGWTPAISVSENNYQRLQLEFADVPSLDVERNVKSMIFQTRMVGETEFVGFDTVDHAFTQGIPSGYESGPVFRQDSEYDVRVIAEYRNGQQRISNIVNFVSPEVNGTILDSVTFGDRRNCGGCHPKIAKNTSSIFVLTFYNELYSIDLQTLAPALLMETAYGGGFDSRGFEVHADTALFAAYASPTNQFVLQLSFANLNTLEQDRILNINKPGIRDSIDAEVFGYTGAEAYILWSTRAGRLHIEKINAYTGESIVQYPEFDYPLDWYVDSIKYQDGEFWIALSRPFDNRIARISPQGEILQPFYQNPAFLSGALALDGDFLWVDNDVWRDDHKLMLMKIALEE